MLEMTEGEQVTLSPSEHSLVMGVLERGPVARQELLGMLNLSAPSLTRLSKRFLDLGVFTEIQNMDAFEGEDTPIGRPSKGYVINPDHGAFIGVKLTATHCYAVLTDFVGKVVQFRESPLKSREVSEVVDVVVDEVSALQTPEVLGLGVSIGGHVKDGIVTHATFLGWKNVDLAGALESRLDMTVTVDNDVAALAEGLRLFGVAKEEPNFALVTIGAGVGQILVLRNQVVRSGKEGVGNAGHVPLDDSGPYCEVGHKGCSQAMLSTDGMTSQLAAVLGHEVEYDELLDLAEAGDGAAWAIVEASERALGRLLAINANISSFSVVVLGGEGAGLWGVAEDHILAEAQRYRGPNSEPIQVLVDQSGFEAWAVGAAAIALQTYIEDL